MLAELQSGNMHTSGAMCEPGLLPLHPLLSWGPWSRCSEPPRRPRESACPAAREGEGTGRWGAGLLRRLSHREGVRARD